MPVPYVNIAILGQWTWMLFVAAVVILITTTLRRVPDQQATTKGERSKRYLVVRIGNIPPDKSREALEKHLKSSIAQDPILQKTTDTTGRLTLVRMNRDSTCATVTFRTSITEDELIRSLYRASEGQSYEYDCNFHGITPLYEHESIVNFE